jgi:hypothetical protein
MGNREFSGGMTEMLIGAQKRECYRIVDSCGYSSREELLLNPLSLRHLHNVEVKHVRRVGADDRARNIEVREQRVVPRGVFLSSRCPRRQVRELRA